MREILFRGKRVDNGEWVDGYFIRQGVAAYISVPVYDRPNEVYQVNPETVGQFTGMHDKQGKKVFEGDVLNMKTTYENNMAYKRFQSGTIIIAGFEDGIFVDTNSGVDLYTKMRCIVHRKMKYEIIGNIHEKEANNG